MRGKIGIAVVLVLGAGIVPSLLRAGQGDGRTLEIFAQFSLNAPAAASSYAGRQSIGLSTQSFLEQVLAVGPRWGSGIEVGMVVPLRGRLGLRAGLGYGRIPLGGGNPPVLIHLDYTSMQPPDYTPRRVVQDLFIPWDETAGCLRNASIHIGLDYSVPVFGRAVASFSAGGIADLFSGEFSPLGSASYWLGGHGVLFSEQYLVFLKIPAAWKVGAEAGIDLAVRIPPRISLLIRISYLLMGKRSLGLDVDKVLYADSRQPVDAGKFLTIENNLALNPLCFDLSAFSMSAGIRFRLGAAKR